MPTIIVQVAMEEEAQPFLDLADEVSEPVIVARAEHRGLVIGRHTIVLVRSGVGMVNAADAAVGALARYGDDVVLISAGSAGGLSADVRLGDVFVGTAYLNLDADARAFGYAAGQVPGMPATYSVDGDVAASIAMGSVADIPVRRGVIASGEKFVTTELASELRDTFPAADLVDMESCAIAQIAHNHGKPFASIRAVSDLCAPSGDEFRTHIDDAAVRSARVVIDALPRLLEQPQKA